MNKLLLALTVIGLVMLAQPRIASADDDGVESDKGDGCGLGWQITNKRTMIATTTRGTTNGFVPPTFGMTSGTINCEQHSFAKNEEAGVTFALANYDSLSLEMASGNGEYVAGFAKAMGCSDSAVDTFSNVSQDNYSELFNGSAVNLYKQVRQQIKSNTTLAQACNI